MDIDYTKLKPGGEAIGIGGTAKIFRLLDVTLTFQRTDAQLYYENLPTVDVLEPSPLVIPSLLGMDVLQKCKISFSGRRCYLEL